jgi:hypothetical protein
MKENWVKPQRVVKPKGGLLDKKRGTRCIAKDPHCALFWYGDLIFWYIALFGR